MEPAAETINVASNSSSLPQLETATTREKKRLFMMQRAERLKDPKMRHMGIDKEALDRQVREREALRQLEKERNDFYDRQALLMDRHAQALQKEVNEIRANREKQLLDYRETYQRKETQREWDLNDPHWKAKDLPGRVGDNDPRTGVSSLQKFEGEDLDYKNRRAAQQRQQREWARQQTEEKLAKKWMEEEANRVFDERNEETNRRIYDIEQGIAEQRRMIHKNQAEFNKALAEQKRREAIRDKEEDTRKALEEIRFHMEGDFLNETETVVSELGKKVKAERYKGMTEEQKRKFLEDRARQRDLLRRRRFMEVEEERRWAQQDNLQLRMANALERQKERERHAERLSIAAEQMKQREASQIRKKQLDELYTNQVDEDYFKYWDLCM
ncbi:flagellar protofilament ribbon protein, putative [Trypanosoma brucei gambiense DAL972]|uniref:Flagellar protofilament ribbon protein, putative n=1 Tax=Trypanosoma brucei gambiense (strain MHOM/CI/86/DAL972) TaxID=679716 RepID=C9ZVR5_TRYB9|nr:flagellar protofilament ribbon protein, putative [Trypanosoma brucei gambiense DAL972]CBH13503.1 flagellar protofilament ribbon protein, putative [Trypanosoma brucei gambiense DAL972]|eukprot:XP_011775780.1 flagellar protofilament ribbon protein, putative [Trypanosoma brucei gambiense DAL972]